MRVLSQEHVYRQLIASVLYVIHEVELSIYRFLSLGAKKSKRHTRSVKLGVNRFTSRWSI